MFVSILIYIDSTYVHVDDYSSLSSLHMKYWRVTGNYHIKMPLWKTGTFFQVALISVWLKSEICSYRNFIDIHRHCLKKWAQSNCMISCGRSEVHISMYWSWAFSIVSSFNRNKIDLLSISSSSNATSEVGFLTFRSLNRFFQIFKSIYIRRYRAC